MKKLITSTFALVFLFLSTNVFAQYSDDVTVTANVEAELAITVDQNVVFGTIQQLAASLDRESADENDPDGTNIGSTAQLGKVTLGGSASTTLLVSYTNATLDNGSDPIAFTSEVRDVTNSANIASGATVDLDGSGNAVLHIGGSLAAPSGTGTYNTSTGGGSPVTITIQYQ